MHHSNALSAAAAAAVNDDDDVGDLLIIDAIICLSQAVWRYARPM